MDDAYIVLIDDLMAFVERHDERHASISVAEIITVAVVPNTFKTIMNMR